jgi:hypothetical protein
MPFAQSQPRKDESFAGAAKATQFGEIVPHLVGALATAHNAVFEHRPAFPSINRPTPAISALDCFGPAGETPSAAGGDHKLERRSVAGFAARESPENCSIVKQR